jgi:hypothetical protein
VKRHHLSRVWSGPVALAVVAAVLVTAPGAGQGLRGREQPADVYVVEHPGALTILNTYQQQLTAAERRVLEPFVPMLIINEHTTLSDGFTPCMTVGIDGQTFFLQRDRYGDLVGLGSAGFHRVYRNVVLLNDSIRTIQGKALRLTSVDGPASSLLNSGEILRRVFRLGDNTYVWRPSNMPRYGWVRLAERDGGRIWEVVSPPPVRTSLSPDLTLKIEKKVQQVNETLRKLFSFFNSNTGAHRAAPQWRVTVASMGLVCILVGDSLQNGFPKSTRQLMKEIEGILIGTAYTVRGSAGRIEIVRPVRSEDNG